MQSHAKKTHSIPITLNRSLGIMEVMLLGIGALLGGGIFTLLGPAAGLSGGGLVFAMLIGAVISFLNLNAYISLATTFPQAGGGYNWVRAGLGDIQGFLAGWFSWMASSVACSLYAVSFGIVAAEAIFSFLQFPMEGLSLSTWQSIFAVGIICIFGVINYRGVVLSGKIGGYISLTLVGILVLYIFFGIKKLTVSSGVMIENFTPFFPLGVAGVVQAAALFYIAFEGSEIQAQTGEEVKNPARTLKIGLLSSWAIVSFLYLAISFIIVGATDGGGVASWKFLAEHSNRAIIESAKQFLPFGYVLMIIGGLLANIAALNATIYSSSRVLFAMARDAAVWTRLGSVHEINQTPTPAILLSLVIITSVAVFFPLQDIAGAADLLFIALFLQLNITYIQLRRKKPEIRWPYIIPFGPVLPLLAVVLYVILGFALFHVSPTAVFFTVLWFLFGLINYFGYTKVQGLQMLEQETVYEHAVRFREKEGYRIIFPLASEEHWKEFFQIACAIAKSEGGEIIGLRVQEVAPTLPLSAGFRMNHTHRALEKVEAFAIEKKINIYTRVIAARSIPEAILETVSVKDGDLLIMGWDGYVNTKGFILGKKVDVVLHRAKCDLLVVKLRDLQRMKKIFIPIAIDDNPNLRFTGKVATALQRWFEGEITFCMVVPERTTLDEYKNYYVLFDERIREIKLKTGIAPAIRIVRSNFIASTILKEAAEHDVILLPAARGRITKAIGMGSIPEHVVKHYSKTVIIAKGHRGIGQPFFDYIKSRL